MKDHLFVTKYDGSKEVYDQAKVVNSILQSGVPKKEALKVLAEIESKIYNGMKTSQLYEIVDNVLNKSSNKPHSYRLREALSKMGSIDFEKFVKEILEKEGFQCQWNVIVQGFCIEHQIDVIAKKEDVVLFVEVKHHSNFHRDCGLGTVIELWGRFDDLHDGYLKNLNPYNFSAAWLFCNTKFSEHAIKYSKAKGLKLTGWGYGNGEEALDKKIRRVGESEVKKIIKAVDKINFGTGIQREFEVIDELQ